MNTGSRCFAQRRIVSRSAALEGHTDPIRAASVRTALSDKAGVGEKLGRNDPCHCGSGKKFKACHGR